MTTIPATLYPSHIVCRALGLEPDGAPAKESGICAFCGSPIKQGDITAPFAVGESFMDDLSLAARGSPIICGYCSSLTSAEALRLTSHGVFHLNGVMPFRKWADVAHALLNPPEPPFVAVFATANNQHMAWRAPVNLSRDQFRVRVGLRDLLIRPHVLRRAIGACAEIASFMGIEATEKSLAHPFASLSSDLKDESHAVMRARGPLATLAEAEREIPGPFQCLRSLTLGESWAMRFVLSPGAGADAGASSQSS
jgi:CRISPR type IV-associated protein Csf1